MTEGKCALFSGKFQIEQDVFVENILYPNGSSWAYHRYNWIQSSGQGYVVSRTKRPGVPSFCPQTV